MEMNYKAICMNIYAGKLYKPHKPNVHTIMCLCSFVAPLNKCMQQSITLNPTTNSVSCLNNHYLHSGVSGLFLASYLDA